MPRPRVISADLLRRLGGAWAAAMVFALGVLAYTPDLHAELHCTDAAHSDEADCAITLFAQGISLPSSADLVVSTPMEWREISPPQVELLFLLAPRYLLQPERGPPFAG